MPGSRPVKPSAATDERSKPPPSAVRHFYHTMCCESRILVLIMTIVVCPSSPGYLSRSCQDFTFGPKVERLTWA
jgi:hypothetical protein